MPYKVLVADDDEGLRRSHGFALEVCTAILEDEITTVETVTSVQTLEKIHTEAFNLIILDNDFQDSDVVGHLPGIALLQIARREGKNRRVPILLFTAHEYENLVPMVEKYGGIYMSKDGYDLESVANFFAGTMIKRTLPSKSP
jgi:CheY-like chemotaxis protein